MNLAGIVTSGERGARLRGSTVSPIATASRWPCSKAIFMRPLADFTAAAARRGHDALAGRPMPPRPRRIHQWYQLSSTGYDEPWTAITGPFQSERSALPFERTHHESPGRFPIAASGGRYIFVSRLQLLLEHRNDTKSQPIRDGVALARRGMGVGRAEREAVRPERPAEHQERRVDALHRRRQAARATRRSIRSTRATSTSSKSRGGSRPTTWARAPSSSSKARR